MNSQKDSIRKQIISILRDRGIEKTYGNVTEFLLEIIDLQYTDVLKLVIEYGIDVNNIDPHPLVIAVEKGSVEIAKLLIANGADILMCGRGCRTLVHLAVREGHQEMLEYLVGLGLDINIKDEDLNSPLTTASFFGYKEMVFYLIENGAHVNSGNGEYGSALHMACLGGHFEIVKILLKSHAEINSLNSELCSALYVASRENFTELIKILIESKADINLSDRFGDSPLHVACYRGNFEVIDILLKNGVDPNICGYAKSTPLNIIIKFGYNEKYIDLLIDNGAKTDILVGGLPLFTAIRCGSVNAVNALLRHKADVNISDLSCTPLGMTMKYGCLDIARILLDHGADINYCDSTTDSPIECAIKHGFKRGVEFLMGEEVNISRVRNSEFVISIANIFNKREWTPKFHHNFKKGERKLVSTIIKTTRKSPQLRRLPKDILNIVCDLALKI